MMVLLLTICMIAGEEGMILQASAAEAYQVAAQMELSGKNVTSSEDSAGVSDGSEESVQPEEPVDTDIENQEENSGSLGGTESGKRIREKCEISSNINDETQGEADQTEENMLTEGSGTEKPANGESEESEEKMKEKIQPVQEEEAEQPKLEEPEAEEINLPRPEGMENQEVIRGAGNYYEQESNNSISEANAISLGTTVYGSLTDNDREDYYKVTLPSAGALKLHLRSNDLACVWVSISFDESGKNGVFWNDLQWNENLKLLDKKMNAYLEPGTYYIKIYEDEDTYVGNYTCEVQFSSSGANDGEPNNSFDKAKNINMGDTITGQISCNDRRDYYKITVGAVGKVTLNMTSYMENYKISLCDGEQKEIWYDLYNSWDENTGMRQDTDELYLEQGIYYIIVEDNGGHYYHDGIYKLNLSFTSSATSFTGDDNSAVNAKPIAWNKTYKGQISINDEYDTYKFALVKGRNIPISFNSNMREYKIKMYDAAGKTVWEENPSYYSGWDEVSKSRKDSYTVTLSAGTYYMEVSGRNDWTGTYSFSLSAGELTSLKLNQKSVKLVKGKKYQLTPAMEPVNCKVTWKSDNPNVASVKSGKITAKGYGQATITCRAQDGSNKTASCKVTVVPAKAKISSVKSGKSYRRIKIKSQSGVTGFEVYTKTKRSSWKLYKTVKGSKNKSLKVKNKYYSTHSFRVRAYKTVGNKKYYGAYSKIL